MKHWRIISTVIIVILLAGIGNYFIQKTSFTNNSAETLEVVNPYITPQKNVIGEYVKDFEMFDINNEKHSLSDWKGKVIVLNFWATWCSPCRIEIPTFIKLQKQYKEQGVQFVGITLDFKKDVKDFLNKFKVDYPVLVGSKEIITLGIKLGNSIGALPYTVIIDRQGNIVFTRMGILLEVELENIFETLL